MTDDWLTAEDTPRPLARGDRIAQRYELIEPLGCGGFGEVWKAVNLDMPGQTVAIKLLHPWRAIDLVALRRFYREATIMASVKHPHVATIHDFGMSDHRHYLVMEFIEGQTLAACLRECSESSIRPSILWSREVFAQICAAVASMHTRDGFGPIVHRDLKPDNIMILSRPNERPFIKILDFGLARLGEREFTRTDTRAGTPEYMAPEQFMGKVKAISPRSDVFALAVIFIELVSSSNVPEATYQWWALSLSSQKAVWRALRRLPVKMPKDILKLLASCLELEPDKRPAHAAAFQELFECGWASKPQLLGILHEFRRWMAHRRGRFRQWAIASSLALILVALGIMLWSWV